MGMQLILIFLDSSICSHYCKHKALNKFESLLVSLSWVPSAWKCRDCDEGFYAGSFVLFCSVFGGGLFCLFAFEK